MPGDYEVGYKKPPKGTRFRKGQSGNPQGRPQGTKNLKTDLFEELQEQVLVREGLKEKQLSKQRALVKSLTANAIKGNTRAANIILNMVLRLLDGESSDEADAPLSADEQVILQTLEERLLHKAQRKGRTRSKAGTPTARRRAKGPSKTPKGEKP